MSVDFKTIWKTVCVALQTGYAVLLEGKPGMGKSSFAKQIARAAGRHLEPVIPATCDPTDIGGLPEKVEIVGKKLHRTIRTQPWFVGNIEDKLAEGIKSILFHDEIGNAPRSVQSVLLRGVLEGFYGEAKLPDDTWTIMASNPPDCGTDGVDFAPPFSNRFYHFTWEPSVQDWARYIRSGREDDQAEFCWLSKNWEAGIPKWEGLIVAYCEARPAAAENLPDSDSGRSGAWASYRSWIELGARGLAALDSVKGNRDCQLLLLSGAIGNAGALDFFTWLDNMDLPKPEDLLKNPDSFEPSRRNDINFVALTSVAQYVAENLTAENFVKGWTVMNVAANKGLTDVAATAARELAKMKKKNPGLPKIDQLLVPFIKLFQGQKIGSMGGGK